MLNLSRNIAPASRFQLTTSLLANDIVDVFGLDGLREKNCSRILKDASDIIE